MTGSIDFYFDFSSPYGYFAAHQIDAVAARHDYTVMWRPFLIGAAFKQTGARPLVDAGIKSDYVLHDFQRLARELQVPFVFPNVFPQMTVAAARAFYWQFDRDPSLTRAFAIAVYDAIFGRGQDISTPAAVTAIAGQVGIDADALAVGLVDPSVKQRLRGVVDVALARGVFGSPFFIVDGEPFWGGDRVPMLERWLETGGW